MTEGKQEHRHSRELAKRVNRTLLELSRQERASEELRGELEQAGQVSHVPWCCR